MKFLQEFKLKTKFLPEESVALHAARDLETKISVNPIGSINMHILLWKW